MRAHVTHIATCLNCQGTGKVQTSDEHYRPRRICSECSGRGFHRESDPITEAVDDLLSRPFTPPDWSR